MFDVFGIFSFYNLLDTKNNRIDFSANNSGNLRIEQKLAVFRHGKIFYCEKDDGNSCYAAGNVRVLTFGTPMTNINYSQTQSGSLKVLQASDIHAFYEKFNVDLYKYVKGNFVIIVFDEAKEELVVISSKLNTLPLFYYYKGNNFIFSSSVKAILDFTGISPRLDEKALVEQLLFYFPLADKTYLNDIFQFPPASILKINKNEFNIRNYWAMERLFYKEKSMPEKEALSQCVDLMKENLKLYTSDTNNFLLALTGGFDSRTNLSLLEKNPEDFLCYSYGMPGSKQIEIPLDISGKFRLNYKPIYLDREFEEEYEKYALKVLEFSDGTAPVSRANFPYAFERLNYFSKINISGSFGSEILKSFHNANEQINQETINLFMAKNFDAAFKKAVNNIKTAAYIKPEIIDKYAEEIRENFIKLYIGKVKSFDKITRFYIFFLDEAVRKYFMKEIRIERYYVDTRMPYFDEDFLEMIFRTPFAGIYNSAGKKDIFSRRNSQVFYAKIIRKSKASLGNIVTDRGYAPNDLLLPHAIKFLKIGPRYLRKKIKMRGNDTFDVKWPSGMIKKYIYKIGQKDNIFTDQLITRHETGLDFENDFRFFSIFSLRLWLHLLDNRTV